MRRAWLVAVILVVAGVALWLLLRPAPRGVVVNMGGGPKQVKPARSWFDFARETPTPEPEVAAVDAGTGPRKTLRFRGRTVERGKGVAATVHVNEAQLESAADGSFECTQPYDTNVAVWAERPGARSTVQTLRADPRGEVWLELEPVTQLKARVLNEKTGEPVPGVAVETDALAKTTTAPDGRFTLPLAPGPVAPTLTAKRYRVLERKLNVPRAGLTLELLLYPLDRFAGVVVDEAGRPVPEAHVKSDPAVGKEQEVRAGPDGVFELWTEEPILVFAWSDTLLSSTQLVSTARSDLRIVARAACRLEVAVTVDGLPAKGAIANVSLDNELRSRGETERGETDASGKTTLGPVPCGPATLETSVQGRDSLEQPVTLAAGTTHVDVALTGGRRLEGRVVDGQTREPASDVLVMVGGASVSTDAEGHFLLTGLEQGKELTLVATSEWSRAKVKVGDEPWVEVVLEAGREVRGRALTPAGSPIRQLTVDSEPQFTEDGRFRVRRPTSNDDVTLACLRCVEKELPLKAGDVDLGDVVLEPALSVEVTVVRPDGRPVSGASVFVDSGAAGFLSRGARSRPDAVTDVEGHARLEGLHENECLRALALGFVAGKQECVKGRPEPRRLTLTLTEGAWVSGVVRTSGRLLAGAVITESQEDLVTSSGADGSYTLGPLSAGTHELFWLPPGVSDTLQGHRSSVTVSAGQRLTKDLGSSSGSRVEVYAKRGVAREVAMLMAGRPLEMLEAGDGVFQQLATDGDLLRATFIDVAPGPWTLFVSCVKGDFRRELEISPSRDERVVVDTCADDDEPLPLDAGR